MNRSRRFVLIVTVAALMLAASSLLAWRSAAAPTTQALPPAGLTGHDIPAAPAPEAPIPGGPAFQMVSAFQFKPRWSNTTWDYQGLDLYNPGTQTSYLDASFSLPNNVEVTGVVVYYYDNSAGDLAAWLYRGDPATGGWTFMAEVHSSGAAAQYRTASDTSVVEALVDQQSYSYLVTVEIPPSAGTLRLIAVRIDYAYGVSLPLALRNH